MKKIISIFVFSMLWCNTGYSDPNNPTSDWLREKTVNELTQKYGYKLFSVNDNNSRTLYTLTNKKIVVTCVVASGNPDIKLYCFLP